MRRHAAWYIQRADVVELVDTHALGACAERREGSSPFIRTNIESKTTQLRSFYFAAFYLS